MDLFGEWLEDSEDQMRYGTFRKDLEKEILSMWSAIGYRGVG